MTEKHGILRKVALNFLSFILCKICRSWAKNSRCALTWKISCSTPCGNPERRKPALQTTVAPGLKSPAPRSCVLRRGASPVSTLFVMLP